MKRGVFWIALTCLVVTSLILASCTKTTVSSTSTTVTTNSTTTTSTQATTKTTTSSSVTTTTTTTAVSGNWWDKLGKPQYGGEMNLRVSTDIVFFDPYQGETLMSMMWGWTEQLWTTNWLVDPAEQSYRMGFWDSKYGKGQLVASWEFTSPGVLVLHVRQGILWQNISPANGREFIADDIVFHYNRMLGLGGGYTKPAPYWGTVAWTKSLTSVTASDKYIVVMNWSTPNPEFIMQNLQMPGAAQSIENPDAVRQWGDVTDWHHAIGTGPFILTDFVSSSSMTVAKNPNYWDYDEHYPQNQLPYVNKINCLIIPDVSTALAGLRSGKIDIMDAIQLPQAQALKNTNPEIVQIPVPLSNGITIEPRNDLAPFKDIKVREALQMAINLPEIASSYYAGTVDPSPLSLTSSYLTGWGFPYSQWPQDLKDQYSYNPNAAKKLLADAGFPNGFKTDIVVANTADLDLLQIVKSYFGVIGVDMEIRPMDAASFSSFVGTNHKNDALAQRATGNLGLGGIPPMRDLNRLQTGQPSNVAMVSDPIFDAFYTQALAATSTDAVKKIISDANEYVARQHFVISLLQPNLFTFCQPWIKGFNGQYGSTAGTNGVFLMFYYHSRFWVDQGIKMSLGH